MIDGATVRALCRLFGLLALTGLMVGCAANPHGGSDPAAGFGKDQASRAARLVSYCDRLAAEGKYLAALGLCARAHELDQEDPETLMKIASLLQTLDRDEAAAQTYTALLAQHPGHPEALYSLGKVYMGSGQLEQAAIQFNRAMVSNPDDPRPYNALGIIRDQAGEHQAAQSLYRSALEQDPAYVSARNNLGLSLALGGNRDEAIEVLAEAAVEPGADETVLNNLEAAYATIQVTPAEMTPPHMMRPSGDQSPTEPPSQMPEFTPHAVNRPANPILVEPLDSGTVVREGNDDRSSDQGVGDAIPIPLLAPATAGEGEQTSALPVLGSAALLSASPVPLGTFVEDAPIPLVEPPAWADFEPGDLLSALPPVETRPEPEPEQMKGSEELNPEPLNDPIIEESTDRVDQKADPYYLSLLNGKR